MAASAKKAETAAAKKEAVAKKAYPQIKVTLVKSWQHQLANHKRTIAALGLKKIGESRIHNDIPAIQGMIFKVKHLVKVEKI